MFRLMYQKEVCLEYLGPNGSGKTTTLGIILDILRSKTLVVIELAWCYQ